MASSPMESPAQKMFCGECGGAYPVQDLARFGTHFVCANCKPNYVQRLREGVQPAGATMAAVHYGGFWIRFLAIFIDGLIIGAVTAPLGFIVGMSSAATALGTDNAALGVATGGAHLAMLSGVLVLDLAIAICYQGYFVSQKGGTLGKLALGLKIVNAADGSNLSVGKAIGRYFAYFLSAVVLYIGYIIVAFDSEKRALHDHVCSTRVIYKR